MEKIIKICDKCNIGFESNSLYANHIRWKHKDILDSYREKMSNITKHNNEKRFGKWIYESYSCYKCSSPMNIKYREGKKKAKYFCTRSCANSRKFSHETELKRSISNSKAGKLKWRDPEYRNNMLKNSKRRLFNSKGELDLLKNINLLFDNKFTSGGALKLNKEECLSRDCYSDELKVCIEYDGIWHFKDINGQLENKIKKDLLLKDWCKNNGYQLIRVKDDRYQKQKDKILELIKETINLRDKLYLEIY